MIQNKMIQNKMIQNKMIQNKMIIEIQKLVPDAIIPQYQSEGAAGFDLCAIKDYKLPANEVLLVETGLAMAIQEGYELQIRPRSGLALKHCVSVLNTPGTIDSDYRGEIKVILINHSKQDFFISKGDRIAQGVVNKVYTAEFRQTDALSPTQRGTKGFGSSGLSVFNRP